MIVTGIYSIKHRATIYITSWDLPNIHSQHTV